MIVPGVNSDIEMNHIRATVSAVVKRGYHAIVVNICTPPQDHLTGLEIIDFRKKESLSRTIHVAKELFGEDSQIYAVGYSLGSNHLLKYIAMQDSSSSTS